MASGNYEYQSEFAKKYVAQGRAEGKAEGKAEGEAKGKTDALLHILSARKLPVTDAQRARILACTDLPTLDRWIERAVLTSSAVEVFSE